MKNLRDMTDKELDEAILFNSGLENARTALHLRLARELERGRSKGYVEALDDEARRENDEEFDTPTTGIASETMDKVLGVGVSRL